MILSGLILSGSNMENWPHDLRLKTRKFIDGVESFPEGGILQMKNIGSFSGHMKKEDLLNGKLIIYAEHNLPFQFNSAGEIFAAGWVADNH